MENELTGDNEDQSVGGAGNEAISDEIAQSRESNKIFKLGSAGGARVDRRLEFLRPKTLYLTMLYRLLIGVD